MARDGTHGSPCIDDSTFMQRVKKAAAKARAKQDDLVKRTSPMNRAFANERLREAERLKIVAWLRSLPHDEYSADWIADQLKQKKDRTP